MTLLYLSLISLVCGPLFVLWLGRHQNALLLADTFVVVAIGGLVFLHILPETFAILGFYALVAIIIGALIPNLADRYFEHQAASSHAHTHVHVGLPFAVGALILHALLDGTALIEHGDSLHHLLALGVILHRFPVGIATWRWVRPHYGAFAAILALFGIGACTSLGVFFGTALTQHLSGKAFMFVQTLVAGSLLHVLLHQIPKMREFKTVSQRFALAAGVILGILSLLLVRLVHDHGTF